MKFVKNMGHFHPKSIYFSDSGWLDGLGLDGWIRMGIMIGIGLDGWMDGRTDKIDID